MAKKIQIARRRLSRRLHKTIQSAARRHARQIGEIVLAWNLLQDTLFVLFWVVVTHSRHEEHEKALAIWHSFQNDKSQRDMLLATARADKRLPKKLLAHLKWIVDRSTDLSVARNIAVHTPVKFASIQGVGVIPIPDAMSGRKQAVAKLRDAPLAATWRRTRGDLIVLADFCSAIYSHIVATGLAGPWPHRPSLLSVPKHVREPNKGPHRHTAKRQSPP